MTPEQNALFVKLTPLQREVVTNILAGMKQVDAIRNSSSKAKTDEARGALATVLLKKVNVKAFLESMQSERVDASIMTRDEALRMLTRVARTSISDIVAFGTYEVSPGVKQTTWQILDSAYQDPAKLAAISELTATKDGPKIRLHSALQAAKQIAEMQRWVAPETEKTAQDVNIHGGFPVD